MKYRVIWGRKQRKKPCNCLESCLGSFYITTPESSQAKPNQSLSQADGLKGMMEAKSSQRKALGIKPVFTRKAASVPLSQLSSPKRVNFPASTEYREMFSLEFQTPLKYFKRWEKIFPNVKRLNKNKNIFTSEPWLIKNIKGNPLDKN